MVKVNIVKDHTFPVNSPNFLATEFPSAKSTLINSRNTVVGVRTSFDLNKLLDFDFVV